ncbi:hypothetical protein JCM33374_g1192 [Metschnikowia sp. JCM 33374]|nr:hypothetical protein JCM33374_g1192 [Metschnikowia sp. JCM 33374]
MANSLRLSPDTQYMASWQYLVNWVLAVIVGLAFVFYFARLVGYIISLFLEIFLWKKYHVRVTIGAFRISPLGGRIMARNVVISTADYTVSILRLNLTWRYWLVKMTRLPSFYFPKNTTEETESPEGTSGLSADSNSKSPTDLLLHMDGLEIFVYNRTAAFENIEETLRKCQAESVNSSQDQFSTKLSQASASASASETSATKSSPETPALGDTSALKFLLQVLPLEMTIKRGAFVLGNHTTPSILVASFRMANAVLDVDRAPSALDHYRTNLDLTMDRFQVHMKPNISYEPDKYTTGNPVSLKSKAVSVVRNTLHGNTFSDMISHLRLKRRYRKAKAKDGLNEWHGLKRYVGEFSQERVVELTDIEEYAKYSLILDSVSTQIIYYYDTPGMQPPNDLGLQGERSSPETGVDLILSMATIHYGSWADRQRGPLHSLLFPTLARDGEPCMTHNEPGSLRNYAGFKFKMTTKNELILRIPTREFSKDKEELATREDPKSKNTRPFGWVELKLGKDTELSSFNSYVATARGWPNTLSLLMADLEVRTSVTHDILFTADQHRVNAEIGFPLAWNGECTWKFDMDSTNGKFFFLREHITLFIDMISDFGSGPAVKFENHRPFTYHLNWRVHDFRLYFNVNDNNIINDPLDFDSNQYICFAGSLMNTKLKIPLQGIFAASSTVDYEISAPHLDLTLEVPPWHTVSAFMDGNKRMGNTEAFKISGYYTYYNKVEVDHNNFAVIDIIGDNITLLFHGYLIRYLFTFRENYFGDFVNFRTFEEYILSEGLDNKGSENNSLASPSKKPNPEYWKLMKAENDLNILFTFKARKGIIILPCQVYDHSHHISLCFDFLDVDIHLCQFYMDLQADFSTAKGYHFASDDLKSRETVFLRQNYDNLLSLRTPEIIIDTFSIHTHRMLGIDDLTYQCKWDFACDLIEINGSPTIISNLDVLLDNFILGYKDLENSLTYEVPIVYDAAHFSFRCPEIRAKLKLSTPETFLAVEVDDVLVTFNDIANYRYSSRISLLLPKIVMKIINETDDIKYDAYMETSLHLTNFFQKLNMKEHRDLQQAHIKRNDATTHRTPFLLFPEEKDDSFNEANGSVFPTISLPLASFPLTEEYLFYRNTKESYSAQESFSDYSCGSSFNNGDMNPTTDYVDSDFKPLSEPDNQFKNDSFILKFETIKACLCPKGLHALSELVLGSEKSDIDHLLDKLQCEIMKDLKELILPVPMIDNVRIVSPLVDIKFVEESMISPMSIFSPSQSVPVLTFALPELSLVIQKQQSRVRLGPSLEEQISMTLALHVSEAYVSVSLPDCFSTAFSLQASEVEAWCTKNDGGVSLASLSLNTLKANINGTLLFNVISFITSLFRESEQSISNFKKASENSERWRGDLLYALCKFAITNKIISDPGVITKPARILRSKRDHVRFYEAWKIMTKLRSIASEVHSSETKRYDSTNESHRAPQNAISLVTESFRAWRTWEGNMKQRESFFHKIFSKQHDPEGGLKAFLSISSLELNIINKEEVSDYIAVQKINIQATQVLDHETEKQEQVNDLRHRLVDFVVKIDEIDIVLKASVFSLAETLNYILGNEKTSSQGSVGVCNNPAWSFNFVFGLNSLRFQFNLIKTYLELTVDDFTASSLGSVHPEYPMEFGWASNLGEVGISFGRRDLRFLNFKLKDTTVIASGVQNEPKLTVDFESNSRELEIQVLDNENTLSSVLSEFLNDDLSFVMANSSFGSDNVAQSYDSEELPKIPNLTLRITVGKFSFLIDALYPLKLHGILTGATFKLLVSEQEAFGEYSHKNFTSDLGINDVSIIRIKSYDFQLLSCFNETRDSWLIKVEVQSDYVKVTTPSLLNALDSILKQKSFIIDKVENLKNEVLKSKIMKPKSDSILSDALKDPESAGKKASNVYFRIYLSQKYCGWFTFKDHSRYTIELEDSKLSMRNSTFSDKLTRFASGELVIPATRITIYDPSFSVGLSTLLDYQLSVKVLNDASTEDDEPLGQSLQVESEYFRVCLSPPVLLKIFELTDSLKQKLDYYDGIASNKNNNPDQSALKDIPRKPIFTSVHVLSYNFCIGWLFGASHKDYPGLILGAERIFAVTKANMGKLTVVDGYLSVANGSTSSSFYSSASEIDNLNRAFMPKLQLNYYVDKHKKLWLTLKGDELDVRCMSNSTVLIERAMKSGTEISGYFEEKKKATELLKENSNEMPVITKTRIESSSKSFNPQFSAVQFTVGFAGARVFIYKLQEENLHEEPNSLTLQSPAVSIVLDYNHLKNASKKHVLKGEILMSQSDNTVYSSCVPVVEDFVCTFKDMFKTSQGKQVVSRKPGKENRSSTIGSEFGSLFAEADLHIGMRIEKQRISLSCEPTAKVAAIVEYDGASISVCSGVEDFDSIYVLGQINSISASLQHIYSDERSGSLFIKSIVLSSMVAFKTDLEVVSSCCITDISGYVKMKQYQDVDLFTDIWYPKTYDSNFHEFEDTAFVDQPVLTETAQNSSFSGMCVALDLIFSNITLEVDFGPALGTMILDVDKAWAISRKVSSWSYEIKLGLQTLLVGSEGRLGGYLKVGGLFLNSAIEWKLDDMPLLEIPLVHMAGGFGEFQLKSIFDEHVFAFANFKGWRFDVHNRKNGSNISKDHLFVSIRYTSAEAYLTSLAVSDFYDIYETILRMVEEKRTSYKEILKDSNKESFMHKTRSDELLEVAKKLDTQIEVFTGITTIQVYPHSFHDNKVFVIQLDRSTANFTQSEYAYGVSNQIELQLNNVKASFSSTAGTTKEKTQVFDVDELSEYASKAKGGTILGFPRFMISMRTYQEFQTNIVQYLYQSSFGGTVDIRWNLGSVNCVREMYSAHKRALLSRTELSKENVPAFKDDLDLNEIVSREPQSSRNEAEKDTLRMLSSTDTPHKDFDKDIQQTMEKVANKSKFTYSPLAPPIIEAPQLKELGNATPPLEWFGLHRNKFPDATHQLAIVTLQRVIHEIELEYSKTLGKA